MLKVAVARIRLSPGQGQIKVDEQLLECFCKKKGPQRLQYEDTVIEFYNSLPDVYSNYSIYFPLCLVIL